MHQRRSTAPAFRLLPGRGIQRNHVRAGQLDEEDQLAAMIAVEQMDFFAVIRGAVSQRLYYHPAIWALLGYEGPSFQQGGYLNRGAGDIDWLGGIE